MPDQDHQSVQQDGYQLVFHPAFASRCVLSSADGTERELYRQQGVHNHPPGKGHPRQYVVQLRGGGHGRDLRMSIDDPRSQVARIVVEFYAQGREPGWGTDDPVVETLMIENNSVECPPNCPSDEPTT